MISDPFVILFVLGLPLFFLAFLIRDWNKGKRNPAFLIFFLPYLYFMCNGFVSDAWDYIEVASSVASVAGIIYMIKRAESTDLKPRIKD